MDEYAYDILNNDRCSNNVAYGGGAKGFLSESTS
jgi:hypothetical protein